MLLIYGSRRVLLHQLTPKSISCKSCNSQGTVTLSSYSIHSYFYYVPMFPLGTKVVANCSHCKFEFIKQEFPQEYKSHTELLLNDSKAPLWQFTGIALIALAILIGIFAYQRTKNKEAEYLANPVEGDVYHYKLGYKQYSTMKVISINGDSIFYYHNDLEADQGSMLSELNVDENYGDEIFYIFRHELDSLIDANAIKDVIRLED